jgi:hypothetical protein
MKYLIGVYLTAILPVVMLNDVQELPCDFPESVTFTRMASVVFVTSIYHTISKVLCFGICNHIICVVPH